MFTTSCQMFPNSKPADVRDATIDEQVNPNQHQESVVQTMPLLSGSVLNLYNQAKSAFADNEFNLALEKLTLAYEIQQAPQVSQLMAEILLHKGDYSQAYHWAQKAVENGPSKGPSCEKSWRIYAVAADKLGDFNQKNKAHSKLDNCRVEAPEEY